MHQSSMVVLPIVTEQRRLMWVHSRQIDQQVVGTAEMREAFDRFPYLTGDETAALAQRCSVHPDQVKVWFMAQRLHYGISWECEDIHNVRQMLMPTGKRERKEEGEGEGEGKGEGEGEGEGDGVATKRMRKKRGEKKSSGNEDKSKGGGAKKRKMGKATDKVRKRRVKKGEKRLQTRSKKTRAAIGKDPLVVQLRDQTSDTSWLADRLPELMKRMNLCRTSETSTPPKKKIKAAAPLEGETVTANAGLDIAAAPRIHDDTKPGNQLSMMRAAFLQCQYPTAEDYTELADAIGIPRKFLVQWFCEMRYYVKTSKPRWMTANQHGRTVAQIKNRQECT